MLIPLQGNQAENAPFPPNSNVTIFRKQSVETGVQEGLYDQVWASGLVIGTLLEVNGPNSCQIISKVKVTNYESDGSCGSDNNQEKEIDCTSSQLRLSVGCSVLVKNSNYAENCMQSCEKSHGIVLGTVDVPSAIRKTENAFWYSIYFPSNGLIEHEVVPERVTYQSNVTDNDLDKPSCNNPNIQKNAQVSEQNKEHDPMPVPTVSNDECTIGSYNSKEKQSKPNEVDAPKQKEQNESRQDEVVGCKRESIDENPNSNVSEKKHEASSTQQEKEIEKEVSRVDRRKRLKEIVSKNWGHEVFVGNIPSNSITENELATVLGVYGKVTGVRLMKGCAKVMFDSESSSEACIADLHNQVIFFSHSKLPMRIFRINEIGKSFNFFKESTLFLISETQCLCGY